MTPSVFHLAHPEALQALWLLAVLAAMFALDLRRRNRVLGLFVERSLLGDVAPRRSLGRPVVRFALWSAALAALVVALARPRWDPRQVELEQRGQNLLFCVDVSNSMRARDVDPSRLEAARAAVRALVETLPAGHQVGLMAYAGAAELKCPLTPNYHHMLMVLDRLTYNSVDVGGTNLGDAIYKATHEVFGLNAPSAAPKDGKARPAAQTAPTVLRAEQPEQDRNASVMVILTDGESHEGHAREMAEEAHHLGVGIYIIGLGTETGAPIPIEVDGRMTTLKYKGQEVITRFDDASLRAVIDGLPDRCGYLPAGSSNVDLVDVYKRVISQQAAAKKKLSYTVWDEKFQMFVGLGLALLVLSSLISEQRPASRREVPDNGDGHNPDPPGAQERFRSGGGRIDGRGPGDHPGPLQAGAAEQDPAGAEAATASAADGGMAYKGARFLVLWLLLACALGGRVALGVGVYPTLIDAQHQFEQARYEQALQLYRQANEAEPGHAAIEYNIALCQLYLGDGQKAIQQFETLATRGDVSRSLRRDAFYNAGLVRARGAVEQIRQLLAPATQPTDRKAPPEDPANISGLQATADELLRAITAFRQSSAIEPDEQTEHNIRAVRILRRDVLGLLRKAAQAKQKDEMLKDPRAYLEGLILEQQQQAGLTRLLAVRPPKEPAQARQARRYGLRAQRKLMENTSALADELLQFREKGEAGHGPSAAAPSTRPVEDTPREKLYKAAAAGIRTAIESQKEACAFLLDGEIPASSGKQSAACEQMYAALYLFPLEPGQVLVKTRMEQAALREMVNGFQSGADWQRDPLAPEAALPEDMPWDAAAAPVRIHQARVGTVLGLLHRQCEYLATASQPAGQPQESEPMLDPQLNGRLAEVLDQIPPLVDQALDGIAARDREATLPPQEKVLQRIDAALELLPKTLEQRITELIARQGRLNAEVQAEAGAPGVGRDNPAVTALDEVRKWATRLKSRLLGNRPARLAEALRERQRTIRTDTNAVQEDVKQKIPTGTGGQANVPPAGSQPTELKAHIEASRHLAEAANHMETALGGFDRTVVEDSLRPMQSGGPVQDGQAAALEELVKALAALQPPSSQPSQDQGDGRQPQQDQAQEKEQDKQRELDRMDKQREQAEQQLYQRRPRTVIKDW